MFSHQQGFHGACELGSLLSDEFLQGGWRHTLVPRGHVPPGEKTRGSSERLRSKWRVSIL